MRLTSETAILKAQGPLGKRKDRRIISRGSHRGVPPAALASHHLILTPVNQQPIHSGSLLPSSTLPRPSVPWDYGYPFKMV